MCLALPGYCADRCICAVPGIIARRGRGKGVCECCVDAPCSPPTLRPGPPALRLDASCHPCGPAPDQVWGCKANVRRREWAGILREPRPQPGCTSGPSILSAARCLNPTLRPVPCPDPEICSRRTAQEWAGISREPQPQPGCTSGPSILSAARCPNPTLRPVPCPDPGICSRRTAQEWAGISREPQTCIEGRGDDRR